MFHIILLANKSWSYVCSTVSSYIIHVKRVVSFLKVISCFSGQIFMVISLLLFSMQKLYDTTCHSCQKSYSGAADCCCWMLLRTVDKVNVFSECSMRHFRVIFQHGLASGLGQWSDASCVCCRALKELQLYLDWTQALKGSRWRSRMVRYQVSRCCALMKLSFLPHSLDTVVDCRGLYFAFWCKQGNTFVILSTRFSPMTLGCICHVTSSTSSLQGFSHLLMPTLPERKLMEIKQFLYQTWGLDVFLFITAR